MKYLIYCMAIFSSGFLSADWTTPPQEILDSSFSYSIAVGGPGNAVAVWVDQTGRVLSSTYEIGANAWSTPYLELSSTAQISNPTVAVDSNGNAVALWKDNITNTIKASKLIHNAGSWTPTTLLSSSGDFNPDVGVDGSGNATAVWIDSSSNIKASRLPSGNTIWTMPVTIGTFFGSAQPAIAVGTNGAAYAIWRDFTPIVKSAYFDGLSWAPEQIIKSVNNPSFPTIGIDNSGNAVAVWVEGVTPPFPIRARKATAGIWDPEFFIGDAISNSRPSDVAVDALGNATVVWADLQLGFTSIKSGTIPSGSNFMVNIQNISDVFDPNVELPQEPKVTVDSAGNLVACWQQLDIANSLRSIFAASRAVDELTTWTKQQVSIPGLNALNPPLISIGGMTRAAMIWFSVPDITLPTSSFVFLEPPSEATVRKKSKYCNSESIVTIYAPVSGPTPDSYLIYRRPDRTGFIAEVPYTGNPSTITLPSNCCGSCYYIFSAIGGFVSDNYLENCS